MKKDKEETGGKKERLSEQMARLEEIVTRLEDESMDIEEAMAAFEEGVKLSRRCLTKLEEISQRVEKLIPKPDGAARKPVQGNEE